MCFENGGNLEHIYDHDISQVLIVLEAQDRYQIVLTAPTALPDVRQFFADTAVGERGRQPRRQ